MPYKMYPLFRLYLSSYVPSSSSSLSTHAQTQSCIQPYLLSPQLEVKYTVASPMVFYIPNPLPKSCSFFKVHFLFPICISCALLPTYSLVSLAHCFTCAYYVSLAECTCLECRDHTGHIGIFYLA